VLQVQLSLNQNIKYIVLLATPDLRINQVYEQSTSVIVNFERLSRDYIINFFEEYFNLSRDTLEKAFGKEWDGSRPRYIETLIHQLYDPAYISSIKVNGNTPEEKFIDLVRSVQYFICFVELGSRLSNVITNQTGNVVLCTVGHFCRESWNS
jgi:hypothetical protein